MITHRMKCGTAAGERKKKRDRRCKMCVRITVNAILNAMHSEWRERERETSNRKKNIPNHLGKWILS